MLNIAGNIDALSGDNFAVEGDLISTDGAVGGTSAIHLTGRETQSINLSGNDLPDGGLIIDKPAGRATLASTYGANNDITLRSGTFDQNGQMLQVNDMTVEPDGTWINVAPSEPGQAITSTTTISSSITNNGVAYLNGDTRACGESDTILIESSSDGVQRPWDGTGTTTLKDVRIGDIGGSQPLTVYSGSSNFGNGSNVTFKASCPSTIRQSAYRWFGNSDSTSPGSAKAGQDLTAPLPAQGSPIRLRTLLHVQDATLAASGENFQLEYSQKEPDLACTGYNHVYHRLDTATDTLRYFDNLTPADGDAITNTGALSHNGDTIVAQTYEEAGPFTNSQGSVAAGEDALFDFAIENASAPAGSKYCLRAVKDNGGALLDAYTEGVQLGEPRIFSVQLLGGVQLRPVRLQ
jgi:hypothetical protein